MTEEIRYIANLQRQEEFDNEVTELEDELKRLEQENKELKKENENYKLYGSSTTVAPVNHTNTEYDLLYGQSMLYRSALEEIKKLTVIGINTSQCNCGLRALVDDILTKINEVLK